MLVRGLGVPVLAAGVGVGGTARRAAARRGTGGGGPVKEVGVGTEVGLSGGVEGAEVGSETLLGVIGRLIGLAALRGEAGLAVSIGEESRSAESFTSGAASLTTSGVASAGGFVTESGLTSSFKSTVTASAGFADKLSAASGTVFSSGGKSDPTTGPGEGGGAVRDVLLAGSGGGAGGRLLAGCVGGVLAPLLADATSTPRAPRPFSQKVPTRLIGVRLGGTGGRPAFDVSCIATPFGAPGV